MKNCRYIAKTLALALIALSALTSGCGQATDTKPAVEVFTTTHPTALQAFQAVYNTADASGKHAVDAKHLASLWLSKELTDGDKKLFVVLIQDQKLDETGALEECRACTAAFHTITFTKTERGWSTAVFQQNIASIGEWGKAPAVVKADVLALTPGNVLLLIPYEGSAPMGFTMKGVLLLNHFQNKWSDLGYVSLAEDNLGGDCSNDTEPSDPKHCYSFTGKLSKKHGKSLTYPDLVVTKKGTEYDHLTSAVIPAKTEVYLFNGTGYVSANQEREKNVAEVNAQIAKQKQVAVKLPIASVPTATPPESSSSDLRTAQSDEQRPIQVDFERSRENQIFDQLAASTKECMRSGSVAFLQQGLRDQNTIAGLLVSVCGGPLTQYAVNTLQWPAKQVGPYMKAVAWQQLNGVIASNR